MKLICNVAVGNRQLSTLAISNSRKYSTSTLALCKHPKKDTYFIILFNNRSKNGSKYEVNGNVSNILTKFLNEGKATIQFKAPPHDFYIQAELIPLQCLLHTLKRILLGTITDKELTCSSLAVTPISSKNIPPKRLVIKNRSEYPTRGFPRTLEMLTINDINRCSLDIGILRLSKLKILDLSNNCIEFLPVEFSNLPCLNELNLSNNLFGKGNPNQWNWINGTIIKSLKQLNLSYNNLIFLPDGIIKLRNLITLSIGHNQLKSLPSGMGNLCNLRVFTASYNNLESLPGSIKNWRLENIDLSHNNFDTFVRNVTLPPKIALGVCSLKEYSAKAVLHYQLPYTLKILPGILIHYLELAKFCTCGKACFDVFIANKDQLHLDTVAKNYAHSNITTIPISCYFCSLRCFCDNRRSRFPFT